MKIQATLLAVALSLITASGAVWADDTHHPGTKDDKTEAQKAEKAESKKPAKKPDGKENKKAEPTPEPGDKKGDMHNMDMHHMNMQDHMMDKQ